MQLTKTREYIEQLEIFTVQMYMLYDLLKLATQFEYKDSVQRTTTEKIVGLDSVICM